MFQAPTPADNSLKFQRIKRNSLNSPTHPVNYANSTHFALKFIHIYLTSFRSLTIDREPQKIGANQPDFAQFAHNFRELHEIR